MILPRVNGLVIILFTLMCELSFAQNRQTIDSSSENTPSKNSELSLRECYKLTQNLLIRGQAKKAVGVSQAGIRKARKVDAKLELANLILLNSVALNQTSEGAKAILSVKEGLQVSREIANKRLEIKLMTELANNYAQVNNYVDAVASYSNAILQARSAGYQDLVGPAEFNLIAVITDSNFGDQAIKSLVDASERIGSSSPLWKNSIDLIIAKKMVEVRDYTSAREWLDNIQKRSALNGNHFILAFAWLLRAQCDPGEKKGDPAEYLDFCLRMAKANAKHVGSSELDRWIQKLDAKNSTLTDIDPDSLKSSLVEKLNESNSSIKKLELLQGIIECCSLNGDWKEAASYTVLYHDISGQMRDVNNSTIESLLASLNSKSVELDSERQWNRLFKNQLKLEARVRQTELEKSRLRYILICVLVLLSSLLAISYQKRVNAAKQASAQKEVELVLRKSNKQWKQTFNGMQEAICTTFISGELILFNEAFKKLFGVSDGDSESINITELIDENFEPCADPFKGLYKLKYLDEGFEKWFCIDSFELSEPDVGTNIYVLRDVSAQVEIRKEIPDVNPALVGCQSDFVAIASHEIRTPLAIMSGALELMSSIESLNDVAKSQIQNMTIATARMKRLVDDLLDFSVLENEKLFLENLPFEIRQTVQTCLDPLRVKRPDLDLSVCILPNVPTTLTGDSVRYGQVLSNLLDNAECATLEGSIQVEIHAEQGPGHNVRLTTVVTDTGEGIPQAKRELVFAPFEQGSNSRKRKKNGLGLGLTICQKICDAMGGEIRLESSSSDGSVFVFECLVQLLPEEISDNSLLQNRMSTKLLVVDDDEFCRGIIANMLQNLGYNVAEAANAMEAIKMIDDSDDNFDIVFMDIMMPEVSGLDAVQELRKRYSREDLVVVALSAASQSNDRLASRFSGFNYFLNKPVSSFSLEKVVEHLRPCEVTT